MEFSGQYLTYEEYKALGGTLDLTPFNLLEFESRRKIDLRTQNRLKGTDSKDIPQEVKVCMFKLINSASNYDDRITALNGNVASESIDGYSVSYITGGTLAETVKAKNKELDSIITEALAYVIFNGEHLIYAGVD